MLVGIVFVGVVVGVFLFARSQTRTDCVTHQLLVGGHYTQAGITAALRAYPTAYSGREEAPSINEIIYARGICGENP